ncbi:MAG: hypothetical protein ABI776_04900 [Nocardioidaceae bacterium]
MPESAEEIYARVVALVGENGRPCWCASRAAQLANHDGQALL